MSLRQAAQRVLEALVRVNASPHLQDLHHAFDEEINALKQALAEPEQIGNARCPRCWEPITAPTPRKPLSEQELDAMRQADGGALNFVTLRAFRVVARAVEAAHGITGETK